VGQERIGLLTDSWFMGSGRAAAQ